MPSPFTSPATVVGHLLDAINGTAIIEVTNRAVVVRQCHNIHGVELEVGYGDIFNLLWINLDEFPSRSRTSFLELSLAITLFGT